MKYIVETVGDDELPAGVASVIVEREDGPPLLLISGDVARCWEMMRASRDGASQPSWQPTIALPAEGWPLRLVV